MHPYLGIGGRAVAREGVGDEGRGRSVIVRVSAISRLILQRFHKIATANGVRLRTHGLGHSAFTGLAMRLSWQRFHLTHRTGLKREIEE